ncbi:MAG: hypothetical protein EOP88_16440 [Verrucomicrobiaceae bacterium]|nr:MAG: hypothetical protein EOP88_16440 [Verrucomicrobiaceae bacterium]
MNPTRLIPPLFLLPFIAHAATLEVGPGEAHTTIQSAVDAASPGDTIEVAAGMYAENVVITKSPLTLSGHRAADDARGRVSGTPNPSTETVVAPAAGSALSLSSGAGAITVSGFSFSSPATGGSGVVVADTAAVNGLTFSNNDVRVSTGATGAALRLGSSAVDATISGNVLVAAEGSAQAVLLDGAAVFHGLHFTNNHVLRAGAVGNTGISVDGNRNVGASGTRIPLIKGNRFEGHALGFNGGARSIRDAEISSNIFHGNGGGLAAGPLNSVIKDNLWTSNTSYGLRLTSFGNTSDAGTGAKGTVIKDNDFQGNGTVVSVAGYGDVVTDDQANGTQDTNVIRLNRFASTVGIYNNEASGSIQAAYNFWNAVDGPGGLAAGSGADILGNANVVYQPFHADTDFKSTVYGNAPLTGEVTVHPGDSIEGESLTLGPAAILHVSPGGKVKVGSLDLQAGASLDSTQGNLKVGKLQMDPTAVLDVVNGDLSLDPLGSGEFHTISGSFTFFNALGSININANTTFSGSTLGIASDIHIAPNVSLFVLGSLVLDGCRVDGVAPYYMLVNTGATFRMARCEVLNGQFNIVGNDVTLHDNRFTNSSVAAFSTVNGAKIYHNVFTGSGALSVLPGAVVTTTVEGWSNVTNPAAVQNELALAFRAPADTTRTLTSSGDLFVQPGDLVDVGLGISKLNHKAVAVETLLGFSTDYLTHDSLVPSSTWANDLHTEADETGVIGRFNSAVGLGFSFADPDGSNLDGAVADIRMEAKALEGETRLFFRTKGPEDPAVIDTRITGSSGGVPFLKEYPFTRNSGVLTIDGTPPQFATGATGVQVRSAVNHDILQSGELTRQGNATFTFDATDLLAGIENADVRVTLTKGPATLTATLLSTSVVDVSGTPHTRYVFQYPVTSTTPDGEYDVDAIAMDRSGNESTLAIGTIEIAKNQITATVQPQGLVTSALTRNVVFTATNGSGTVLHSWTVPVNFLGGSGTTVLENVPDGTANVSAKMAWNRRVRLPVTLDVNGQGSVSFTGTSLLRGGDFTGDNNITVGDYNVLRSVFPGINPAADITGDGIVNVADYNILRTNLLTAGDPL